MERLGVELAISRLQVRRPITTTHRSSLVATSRRYLSNATVGISDVNADRSVGEHWDGLGAEVDDRDDDRRHGHGGEGARTPRTVWFFAQQPDEALPVTGRHLTPLHHETFLLLELADDGLVHLVELELLDEHVLRHFQRTPQSTAALVVVQYRLTGHMHY